MYCLTVPEAGNFALEAGVFVHNCGIIVNVTPLEPEWEGHVTLEFSNTTPLPAKIYANEGVAQVIFLEAAADDVCETSYSDRGGKYQGQSGVTLPEDLGRHGAGARLEAHSARPCSSSRSGPRSVRARPPRPVASRMRCAGAVPRASAACPSGRALAAEYFA